MTQILETRKGGSPARATLFFGAAVLVLEALFHFFGLRLGLIPKEYSKVSLEAVIVGPVIAALTAFYMARNRPSATNVPVNPTATRPWLLIIGLLSGSVLVLTLLEFLSGPLSLPLPLPYPLFAFIAVGDVLVILVCFWPMIRARNRPHV